MTATPPPRADAGSRTGVRADPRAARAVAQLSTLLATGELPPRAQALCTQVAARLAAPVRMSLVGRPDAAPVALANALLGGHVLPEIEGLPPAEVGFAPHETWHVVTAAGASAAMDAQSFMLCDPLALALLRRSAPVPLLQQVALRVVTLDGDEDQARSALAWTLRGAEMLLWCSAAPKADAPLLAHIPDPLFDHAFLAILGPGGTARAETAVPGLGPAFVAAFRVGLDAGWGGEDTAPGSADVDALRAALLEHLSRGRREDLDFALTLLERYMPRPDAPTPARAPWPPSPGFATPPGDAIRADADAAPMLPSSRPASSWSDPWQSAPSAPSASALGLPASAARPVSSGALSTGLSRALADPPSGTGSASAPSAAESSIAARIVDLIAARAASIELPAHGPIPAARVLAICADTLTEAAAMAGMGPCAGSPTAPAGTEPDDLPEVLAEAADLMLLIQMEDSPGAAADSLALLLQARRECEARLAA